MRNLLPLLMLLLCARPAKAAIAFDAVSSNTAPGNVSSFTFAHVMGSGSGGVIVCGATANTSNNNFTISGITYASVSLNNIRNDSLGANSYKQWIGQLVAPATGSNTVQVTLSAAPGGSGLIEAGCISFTGVNQISPVDSTGCTTGNTPGSALGTCNVTTVAANAMIVDLTGVKDNTGSLAANSPQTSKWIGPTFNNPTGGMSYNGPIATPAATSDGWHDGSQTNGVWILSAISLAPAGAGASGGGGTGGAAGIGGKAGIGE